MREGRGSSGNVLREKCIRKQLSESESESIRPASSSRESSQRSAGGQSLGWGKRKTVVRLMGRRARRRIVVEPSRSVVCVLFYLIFRQ